MMLQALEAIAIGFVGIIALSAGMAVWFRVWAYGVDLNEQRSER